MTAKALISPIGPKVRELRRQRRWTQVRLAKLLSVTQSHLSQLERGKRSFTAEQLLLILQNFNVPVEEFGAKRAAFGSQLQNALAGQGAGHLTGEETLPSDRLKNASAVIRETLISADSSRQIAAIAPVIVNNSGQLNLTKLRNELAELGLDRRFCWAIESTLEAIKLESDQLLTREWRLRYRRAATIIESYIAPFILLFPTENPDKPTPYDVLDPEITSPETLKEVVANLSPLALKWRIATKLEVDDFTRALRAARGAD